MASPATNKETAVLRPGPSSARCLRAGTCSDSRVASYGVTDIVWPRGPEDSPSSAADRVFRIVVVLASRLSCPLHWGPSPLAAKLVAGHGAGDEREPGRDARMPPGLMDGFPDGRDVGRVYGDPGDPGPGDGRQPGSSSGDRALERRGGAVLCGLGRRGAGGCGCPAHPYPVVTLSDMGGRENARRAADMDALAAI
jgi:hypothetical protein